MMTVEEKWDMLYQKLDNMRHVAMVDECDATLSAIYEVATYMNHLDDNK